MDIDKKTFLEHTSLFEKKIEKTISNGFNKLSHDLLNVNKTSPCIYTCVLDKDISTKYDYFLKEMIENDNISQNSKYLDSVYIDIDYYNLLDIEDKVYIGEFILSNEVYRFKYKFTKDNRYDEKISSLYNSFLNSNLVWYSIDKRYINKMYRIEVLEYIDDISLISDIAFCDLKLEYHLDSNIYLNKKIYWNVSFEPKLFNKELSRVDKSIVYRYTLDKSENEDYLIDENSSKIDDVCIYDNKIEVYSRYDNLYVFDIYNILNFDLRYDIKYSKSIPTKLFKVFSIDTINKFLDKSYNIKLREIKKEDNNNSYLIIPDYDKQIYKYTNGSLYLYIDKFNSYDDLFHAINLLKLSITEYDLRVVV